ncbi:MAG TPA: hypothetical protein VGJ63_04075 [Micromonosporaceae bacterium]|jgi:hypothetical protein
MRPEQAEIAQRPDRPVPRFGPTIAEAWRLWLHNVPQLGLVALAVVTPLVAVVGTLTEEVHAGDPWTAAGFVLTGIAVTAVGEALCVGLAEHILRRDYQGQPRMRLNELVRALPLGTLSVLAVIVGVAVSIGLAVLVVPGLAAFAWLSLATPAASFKGVGVAAALRTSIDLVRGRFWPVAAVTTATFVPAAGGDAVAAALHARQAPGWIAVPVEGVAEAVVVSLTSAVVVVVYHTLSTTQIRPDMSDGSD